jgi:NADP-dependent 3-hydroxy acid dehydrogenase YdfG
VKTIAIFGAGPALGLSLAKRFGREGYRIALVARRQESLDALSAELTEFEHATFTADLIDRAQVTASVAAIEERFGHVDVAVYSPGGLDQTLVGVLDVDPDVLLGQLDLQLLTPIALVRALLPGMRARGDGALLFASGASATTPVPQLGNVSLTLAATRNYVLNVNSAVAADGVYAGVVPIGGLISGSAAEAAVLSSADKFADFDLDALKADVLDPADIADVFWDLALKRDRAEVVVGG